MREIKFRAWDKELQYLGRVAELTYFPYGREIHEERIGYMRVQNAKKPSEVNHYTESEILNLVIEQYTGVKDDNGFEIYEGDILTDVDDYRLIGVVEYENGCFTVSGEQLYDAVSGGIIIGNIHEDKELLGDFQ